MGREQTPWQAIRERYEQGGISYKALSTQYDVPVSVIGKRAKREDWRGDRKQYGRKKPRDELDKVVEQLTDIVSNMVEKAADDEKLDVKTLKELTAVLKELNNMSKDKNDGKADNSLVRVVLEGNAKEWAL